MALKPYTGAFDPLRLKPYDGDFTPVTSGVHRPDEPSVMEEFGAKLKSGAIRGVSGVRERTAGLLFDEDDEQGRVDKAQRIAQSERRAQMADRTSASTRQGLQEIAAADTFGEAVKATVTNPRAVGMTTAQSLGMFAPVMAAGAASGPAAPAVIGAGSGAIEYEMAMRETLEEHGVDLTDASQIRRALEQPRLMARARDRALKRGVAIGAFDALTAGVAGRLVAGSRGVISAATRTGGETGVQLGGGMAGEATAQLATEGRITSPGDVVMEGIAEVPTTITEVPTNYRRAREGFQRRESDRNLVQDDYRGLADEFGATITSLTRSPAQNRRVRGVANSQHLRGTAGDFVVPDDRKADFIAAARKRGYEAIDEGDHVHLELPSGKAGRAALDARRRQRVQAVLDGMKSPGAAQVEDSFDRARDARDLDLEVPQTPKREKSKTGLEDKRANVDDLIAGTERTPASSNIEALKEQMLDQVAQQAFEQPAQPVAPTLDTGPLDAQPAPVADIGATLPDQPSLPMPGQSTNDLPPGVATPAQQVPAAPMPEPVPQQAAPEAPQATATPPATPVPPEAPAPAVAPPAPQESEWEVAGQYDVPQSEKDVFAAFLSRQGLAKWMGAETLTGDQVAFVALRPEQQERMDELGRVLGRRIILYDVNVPGYAGLGGFNFDDKHVFVNVRAAQAAKQSVLGIVGHEFVHSLRRQGSPLLEELIRYARTQINTDDAYVQQMYALYRDKLMGQYGKEGFSDTFTEELVADFIGDLLNDEQFWAELAEQDMPLFKRIITALVRFLSKMADKARRLGSDTAFHDIETMRQQAVAIMREHLRDPNRATDPSITRRPHLRARGIDTAAHLGPDYRADLVKDRGTKMAASYFERGDYMSAANEAGRISPEFAPPMPIDTPEKRAFFRDSSRKVNQTDQAGVYFHGTARNIDRFKPKTGDAVFLAERSSFSGPYAAASMAWQKKQGEKDVIVDGKSMREQMTEHRRGTPEYVFADLMQQAQGDVNKALDLIAEYAYMDDSGYGDILFLDNDPETREQVIDMIEGVSLLIDDDPSFVRTVARRDHAGMQIIPLVTNAKNPWDFDEKGHVKKLVEALRDKYRTPAAMKEAMDQKQSFETWDAVASALSRGAWPLIEDRGAGIPQLIRELGYDAYFVAEEGHKNLAVYDPKQIKSAYGNLGMFGTRKPTAEEAASLGMTLEEAFAAQEAGDIRLRLGNLLHHTFTNPMVMDDLRAELERVMLDEFRDVREIQKQIAAQYFGGTLPPGLDAHGRENWRHGAYQDARKRAEEKFIAPIAKTISRTDGASLEGFSDFLWWRHASERDAYLRSKMDPQLAAQTPADALAGIDPADAQANIAALDPSVRAAYERAAKFIDGMRKFTLDTLLASGQITKEHHDALLDQYDFYVPLRGMPDGSEVLNGRGQKRGLDMNKNPIGPRAKGRRTKPENIIEHMVRDMDLALLGKQKQYVLDALVGLIAAHPDPDLWEVSPVKAERKWVNGVLTVVQTNGEPKDQITFMHRGIPVKIEIRHEGMRKAILNMTEPFPQWLRRVGRLTRWLSAVKTSFSPFFMLINPVRDAGLASMAIMSEHGMGAMKSLAEFYPYALAALRADDTHLKVAPSAHAKRDKARVYAREWAANGGKTGFTYVNDIREQQRKLTKLIARHSKTKGMADIAAGNFHTKDAVLIARKAQQHIAHLFEVANDVAEGGTRLAVYIAMREQGKSIEEAVTYSKEVTVNFNRRGSFAKYAGVLYMFFNASVQGGARFARLTFGNKKFLGMLGGMFAASYAMALSQMLAAGDDDDGESNYDKAISDGQAQRSISVYLGGGKSLAIPVPYGPNIATYMGYRAAKLHYDLLRGRNPSVGKAAGDMMAQALTSMSPLDPGKGWQALMPEMLRVPMQAANNRSDFGGKLNFTLVGSREEKLMPLADKTLDTTGAPYRWAAAALNSATGGSKYRPGSVNLTGEQTRYIAEQFGGGLLRLATESYSAIHNGLAGIDPEPSDVPLANVYFRGKGEMRHAPSYYENKDDFDRGVAQWRKAVAENDVAAQEAILKRAPWVEGSELSASTREGREAQSGTLMEVEREVRSAIRDLRQEQEEVRGDPNLDWRERKRILREIDVEIAGLQKDFNYAINRERGVRSTRR